VGGNIRFRRVLTRDGNEAVLYVTSAALILSAQCCVCENPTYMIISGWFAVTQSGSESSQSNVFADNATVCLSSPWTTSSISSDPFRRVEGSFRAIFSYINSMAESSYQLELDRSTHQDQ
jgi:hypothetical protein